MEARVRSLALIGVVLAACAPGRVGRLDPDGGLLQRPDGNASRFDAAARDGSVVAGDGAVVDGAIADRDGAMMSFPDGAMPPLFEIDCNDGFDADDDGLTDCEDDDCDGLTCDAAGSRCEGGTCGGCGGAASETMCGDGLDDDCDDLRDCEDPDCAGQVCGPGDVTCSSGSCPCPSGFEERICDDGTDDDCDSLVDCADPDCMGRTCAAMGLVCLPDGSCDCPGGIELCQGIDDDCSGTIDEGCPAGIGSCCQMTAGAFGGLTGTAWIDECPVGAVLIGIAGRASTRLDQIQPICATLLFEVDETRPEHTFYVRPGAAIPGGVFGGTGGTAFDDRCPDPQVVIGVRGHADTQVDQVQLRCGTVSIARNASFNWQLSVTPAGTTPLRGSASSVPFAADCGARSVVTALDGRDGTHIDRLGATCRQLQLNLR